MLIDSNDIRIRKTSSLPDPEQTAKTSRVGSVFANICEKSLFVNSVKNDVEDSLGAFFETRRDVIFQGKKNIEKNSGLINKIANFIINQGKGFIKGAGALLKKAGTIPAACAAMGFCTAVPGGTSIGLTIGVIVKNLLKVVKNIKI